jgi:putative acyl-CoA dehydrogenase
LPSQRTAIHRRRSSSIKTAAAATKVEFHPAYHQLMAYLKRHGASAGPWAQPARGAHVKRAAFYMMYAEIEDGTLCPTTMTYAVVPSIAHEQTIAREWLPRIHSLDYDPRFIPAAQKRGVTLGMGMTEKQGGSDLRSNVTTASPRAAANTRSWATSGSFRRRCRMHS